MGHRGYSFGRGCCATLIIILAVAILFVRANFPERPRPLVEINYLPSGKLLRIASLGYDSLVADLLWVKSVIYFGDEVKKKGDFRWVSHYFDLITDLNPPFEAPYEFGGIVLAAQLDDVDGSIALLDKGMKNVSKDYYRYWLLPFYQAFNYMIYKEDYKTAALFLREAIEYPQSPPFLPLLLTRLYAATDDEELGIEFLDTFQSANEDPLIAVALKKRREELRVSMRLSYLQERISHFEERFLFTPYSLDLLITLGVIPPLFYDDDWETYFIGGDGVVGSTALKKRLTINRPGKSE